MNKKMDCTDLKELTYNRSHVMKEMWGPAPGSKATEVQQQRRGFTRQFGVARLSLHKKDKT